MINREQAQALDQVDPLREFADRFVVTDPNLIYLDGNSLGRQPRTAAGLVTAAMDRWADELVGAWRSRWIDLPRQVGAALAPLIGADPADVMITDQTTVNLYKLAAAAMTARPERHDIITHAGNFPSDLYVLNSLAVTSGGALRVVEHHSIDGVSVDAIGLAVDDQVALVSLSHVDFRSGSIADLPRITDMAHEAGALVLWDLSHSVGVIPTDLRAAGVDLAVGCTYKYLNGGPGAPAFLYVSPDLQAEIVQPIQGWFGHEDMFAFDPAYRPAADIRRFGVGTPPILSLIAAGAGIDVTVEAGVAAIREKSMALTSLQMDLFDDQLATRGFELATPRDPVKRGGHVSLSHPDAYRISRAMIEHGVIPDFRAPNVIRLGLSPLYTSFIHVWAATRRLAALMDEGAHTRVEGDRTGVS
ncbi:MAG: kynureninase [Acidimicrobiia bacterium]